MELHRRYAGVLYDKCVRILRDPADAEDAVQETYVKAFRSLHQLSRELSPLPWLHRIATNVCLDRLRVRRRREPETATERLPLLADTPRDPVRALHLRRCLARLLAEQDRRGRQVLVACYVDGMTQAEVGASLGISRRAVVKRLGRLRARLRELVEQGDRDG